MIVNKRNKDFKEVNNRKILYITGVSNTSILFLENGKPIIYTKTLKVLEERGGDDFVRCHRCFLLNISKITGIDLAQKKAFIGEKSFDISRRKMTSFINATKHLNHRKP